MAMTPEQQKAVAIASARARMEGASREIGDTQFPVKIGADSFPDDLRGVLREQSWGGRNLAAAGTGVTNLWEGVKQFAGQEDKSQIAANRIIRDEAPVGAIAGDVALTALPFSMVGNSVKGAAAIGGGYGLSQPVEGATGIAEIAKGKATNAVIGAAAAGAGQAVSNKLFGAVGNKMSSIEQKVQDKAAKVAASETASARSAAGRAAQDAYKQLEHLRELGANRALTPSEKLTVQSLERELAEKALEKLMPAAASKQATSEAYKEAMKTEAQRAAEYAASKLSGNEAKQQLMARIKRYGPAVAGGVMGNFLFPGIGGAMGGAASGLVLRPAVRSMINLSSNPAVQHGLLSATQAIPQQSLPIASLLAGQGLLGK